MLAFIMTKTLEYLEKGDIHVQGEKKVERKKIRIARFRVYYLY